MSTREPYIRKLEIEKRITQLREERMSEPLSSPFDEELVELKSEYSKLTGNDIYIPNAREDTVRRALKTALSINPSIMKDIKISIVDGVNAKLKCTAPDMPQIEILGPTFPPMSSNDPINALIKAGPDRKRPRKKRKS